ncbi:MAG: polyamine ABC transporter substrate-binding protein [Rhodospirillales bacterium]|nr:polyamine ABC transporter substrate-binding protein [Rhodospirillales bacterium]
MRKVVTRILAATAAVMVMTSTAHSAEEKALNVYNWSDYIAPDTLDRFEKETGIKVNYDVYDSNEILEAKLMAGNSGYDVVFPTASPFLARQIQAGIYQPLDPAKLPNRAHIDAAALATLAKSDPDNTHAVPYMIAGTGIGVNLAKVKELAPDAPLDSWSILLDPKWTGKLKACGVTLLDDATEVLSAAFTMLGIDPATEKSADIDAAVDYLSKVRQDLKYIHSSSYINDLANGDICVAHGYGGDLVQARDRAREAAKGVDILVFFPKEGTQAVMDVMAIPADAPHPENAHAFIDFMMRPDVVGPITDEVGYANAVDGAEKFVSAERLADPVIYPPKAVRERFFVVPPKSQAYERSRTRAWTRFKTGM